MIVDVFNIVVVGAIDPRGRELVIMLDGWCWICWRGGSGNDIQTWSMEPSNTLLDELGAIAAVVNGGMMMIGAVVVDEDAGNG